MNDDRAQYDLDPETDRSVTVDEFLMRCNNVPGLGEEILRLLRSPPNSLATER